MMMKHSVIKLYFEFIIQLIQIIHSFIPFIGVGFRPGFGFVLASQTSWALGFL